MNGHEAVGNGLPPPLRGDSSSSWMNLSLAVSPDVPSTQNGTWALFGVSSLNSGPKKRTVRRVKLDRKPYGALVCQLFEPNLAIDLDTALCPMRALSLRRRREIRVTLEIRQLCARYCGISSKQSNRRFRWNRYTQLDFAFPSQASQRPPATLKLKRPGL